MPDYSYKSGKLNRSHLLHYLDTTFAAVASSPSWYLLGKDVEDASVALNPDTSTKKNILDETTVEDNGYEPEFTLRKAQGYHDESSYRRRLQDKRA